MTLNLLLKLKQTPNQIPSEAVNFLVSANLENFRIIQGQPTGWPF